MKKLALVIIAAISIFYISCRKDMTCTCESTTVSTAPSGTSTTVTSDTKTLNNVKKGEGRVNCMSRKYAFTYYTILGDSVADTEITCSLN